MQVVNQLNVIQNLSTLRNDLRIRFSKSLTEMMLMDVQVNDHHISSSRNANHLEPPIKKTLRPHMQFGTKFRQYDLNQRDLNSPLL